mgnify:CR=1 FL=1
MPGFDRSGPMGQGARTGRGMGRCNPNNAPPGGPDMQNAGGGAPAGWFGRGGGGGRGRGGFGCGQGGGGFGRGGGFGGGRGGGGGRAWWSGFWPFGQGQQTAGPAQGQGQGAGRAAGGQGNRDPEGAGE